MTCKTCSGQKLVQVTDFTEDGAPVIGGMPCPDCASEVTKSDEFTNLTFQMLKTKLSIDKFIIGTRYASETLKNLSWALFNLHDLELVRNYEIEKWWGEDGLDPMKKGWGGI
jgi:tRNA U54 and U55 pseudouridine synthase Pus10